MKISYKKHISDIDRSADQLQGILNNAEIDYNKVGRLVDIDLLERAMQHLKDLSKLIRQSAQETY